MYDVCVETLKANGRRLTDLRVVLLMNLVMVKQETGIGSCAQIQQQSQCRG
jgi:hypothetical protein